MTLPAIKDFLAENGLTFLGFEVDFRTAQLYSARFPADKAMTDLDQWHQFEQDRPTHLPACTASGCRSRFEEHMMLTKDDIETLSAGAGQSPDALFNAVDQVAARRVNAGLVP